MESCCFFPVQYASPRQQAAVSSLLAPVLGLNGIATVSDISDVFTPLDVQVDHPHIPFENFLEDDVTLVLSCRWPV